MKYVILANSSNKTFDLPKQLSNINGEPIIKRTIRLLKENGIEDIIISSNNRMFTNLGAKRYSPKHNRYNYGDNEGYWLDAFPSELLIEPITFLMGDVYYSENAIKTIVETETKDIMFFCSRNNNDIRYIKHHDEPFAFKVVDYNMFKEHIDRVKTLKDNGKTDREPIAWELYRSLNNIDVNTHIVSDNATIINDITCDIDSIGDIKKLEEAIGYEETIIARVTIDTFTYSDFDNLKNIKRASATRNEYGRLYLGDTFSCNKNIAKYLLGDNTLKKCVIEVIEIIPIEKDQ